MFAAGPSYAADDNVAELKAEIARLKEALTKSQQALESQRPGNAAPAPAAAPSPAVTTRAASDAKEEDAPTVLGEVTVRSRNRIERLQDVPLSVSVVTGQELEQTGSADLGSITKRAANVSWNQGNQRTSSLSIRGIGKIGQTEAQDPSVGVVVDGVNYAYNPLSSFDFADVEAVEVTRGPQGTLFGKNASLGLINITTKRPSFKRETEYSLTFGQNDTFIGKFATGGPVVDDLLAWRGTFYVNKGAGDMRNAYNYDSSYKNWDRVFGRAQFLLTPSSDFNARLSFEIQPRAGENTNGRTIYTPTPTSYTLPDDYKGDPANKTNKLTTDASTRLARRWFTQYPGYTYTDGYLNGAGSRSVWNDAQQPVVTGTRGTSAELNWNLGSHTLTSITAFKDYRFNAHNNDEGTPFDIQRSSGQEIDYKQYSEELRLASKGGESVDYQTGIFLMKTSTDIRRNVIYGADAGAWYASSAQYTTLDADGAGRYLLSTALDKLWKNENQYEIRNRSAAIFGQADWHFSDQWTLTTGLRLTHENRENKAGSVLFNSGNGTLLNPSRINDVVLGGFDAYFNSGTAPVWVLNGNKLNAKGTDPAPVPGAFLVSPNTTALTTDPTNAAALAQANAQADAAAALYFGTGKTWSALTAGQKKQIAYAQAIRKGQIGSLWNPIQTEPFSKTQPSAVISPSFRVNDNVTTYLSWQYGEKAGIAQTTNGVSTPARAEKSSSFEWGVKSLLLDKTLVFNADIFATRIKDYQQAVQIYDQYTTDVKADGKSYYVSYTGNVPRVNASGVEIDGVYGGIKNTTIRFAASYNKATYKEFRNSAQPPENGYADAPLYQDVSGQTLPGAPKFSFNVGGEYRLPVLDRKEFHVGFNTAYTSRYNSDTTLSSYGWIPANSLTDLNFGLGRIDKSFDVSILVKNAFNNDTPLLRTWNSYTPAYARWAGLVISGKL